MFLEVHHQSCFQMHKQALCHGNRSENEMNESTSIKRLYKPPHAEAQELMHTPQSSHSENSHNFKPS